MDDPDQNLPAEVPGEKKKRGPYAVSAKLAATLTLLASGECRNQIDACKRTGMSQKALGQALRKPHVQQYMQQNIMTTLSISASRAAHKVGDLMESSPNQMVQLRAAIFSLAAGAGVGPPERPGVAVNVNLSPGYVIDIGSDPRPPASNVVHFPAIDGECEDVTPVAPERGDGGSR